MIGEDFLFTALIFLLVAVFAAPLALRIGFSSAQGFVIGGALVGPWGLGLIAEIEVAIELGQFGIVILMFVLGLEFEPKALWRMRKRIFFTGGLQLFATALLITVLLFVFGFGVSIAILGGVVIAFSSPSIGLQALKERQRLGTDGGQAAMSVFLFQLVAFFPAAIFVLLTTDTFAFKHTIEFAFTSLISIAVAAFAVVGGLFLIARILRFSSRIGEKDVITAAAALLAVGGATTANFVGLPTALGSFLAGGLIAQSEFRFEVESRVEPFKSLLVGVFFMSLGASVDPSMLTYVVVLVVSVMGLKTIILYSIAVAKSLPPGERWLFCISLLPGGELGLMLIGLFTLNSVERQADEVELLKILILATIVLTPLVRLRRRHTAQKLGIFVCYSRRESEQAARLVSLLEAEGFDVTIDTRDLPFGEEWRPQLGDAIRKADTVIWLVSPASVKSKWCNWELRQVEGHRKRLIPVVLEAVPTDELPVAIGDIQLLPAKGTFDVLKKQHAKLLIEGLKTNQAWIKEHTRLSERAFLWDMSGRSFDYLLRGKELEDAEAWSNEIPELGPSPAPGLQDFIRTSRNIAKQEN